MRTTIFIRIVTVTLLPVLIVLLIVIGTARNVIYMDGISYAKEYVRLGAKQISEQTADKLENAAVLQNEISMELALLDLDAPKSKSNAEALLTSLLLADRSVYSAWFAFEREVFPDGERYYKSYIRTGRESREILELYDMSDEQLDNPAVSPWYNLPLTTGYVYANVGGYYDFGTGEGPIRLFEMTYPIITDEGRIIGCVGLEIRYENLFPTSSPVGDGTQRMMLVSTDGTVLYSRNSADMSNSLWDYGFQNTSAVEQAMRKKSVWREEVESPFSNENLLVCLYPIDIYHTGQVIYLYHDTPASNLYSSFYSSMEIIIATGVLGILLLGFCVFFTTRGIVRHVKRITDGFYRVANGNAGATLDGKHIPIYDTNVIELDILQSALISMMVQLRRAHDLKMEAAEAEVEKEKLIAASQAKTNFFAAMSHEIRTPMNAILGISEIMLFDSGLTAEQEKYVQDIKTSADALLGVIDDILDVSKMESGKMELHLEHYNFRSLLDNITSMATHLAMDAGLRFIYKPEGEPPICLYGDGARLRQVLVNLIGNAIKFTRDGYVMLRVTTGGDNIRFDVVDTGIGLSEDEVATIFESFKQLDTRRNREVKGTGLGLSISKNLTELMGGVISVESSIGKGSTFSVTLPLELGDESKLRHIGLGAGARYSSSLKVLVVDDNEINLNVSSGLFKVAHGIICDTAISGWEAISKVQKQDYDIIFMDHMMPGLDGVDTTQRIRQLGGRHREVPIIALTANAVIGSQKELLDGGMDDFLAKPIQIDRLREILNTWIPDDKRLTGSSRPDTTPPKPASAYLTCLRDRELLEREGLDIMAGLANIAFDEETYLHSLRIFKDKLPESLQLMDRLLERKEMREFQIQIHGMKGSLGSIGAIELSAKAQDIENMARADNAGTCRAMLTPLAGELKKLYAALKASLPGEEPPTAGARGELDADALSRLCKALEKHDYEGIISGVNDALSAEYAPELEAVVSRVKRLIDSFDYDGAAVVITDELLPGGSAES